MQPRTFQLLIYSVSYRVHSALKMPNFGDMAQENTSGGCDGDEWPAVLSNLRSWRDTLDTRGFFSRAAHAHKQSRQLRRLRFERSELERTNVIYLQ